MKLTDQQKIEICEKYKTGNYTYASLGKEYFLHPSCISRMVRKRGIKTTYNFSEEARIHTINHNYFDVIDSEDKAYFLGLLYADGYNCQERGYIRLCLQEDDKYILDNFNKYVNSDKPLFFDKKKNPKWKNMYQLVLYSTKMSNKLSELGCTQAKSLTLQFPTEQQVPKDLLRHFIRGMFDGDGCISVGKHKSVRIYITSSSYFCSEMVQEMLNLNIKSKFKIRTRKNNHNSITSDFIIDRKHDIYKFCNWMYQDSSLFLKRKYNIYKKSYEESS